MDNRTTSPAQNAVAVTPSDTTVLGCRNLWVGGAGSVVVDFAGGGTSITFAGVPAGTMLNVSALRVKAATTATNIVALY